jgi:hypothetical protein
MSKPEDIAGYNTRYADDRFQGHTGSKTANTTPNDAELSVTATDPAGTYDSATTQVGGSTCYKVGITVTETFDGAATLIVGTAATPNLLVTLADAVVLTATGTTTVGGAPSQGSALIQVYFIV